MNSVVVEETFQYSATPDSPATATTAWDHIQTCREVHNHALTQEYRPKPDWDKPSYTTMQNKLTGPTGWKTQYPEWTQVYSKCLQMAIRRIKSSETVLESLKDRGYNVGQLKWKPPREYRSIVYNQSGFDVDNNTDRTNHAIVNFSKIGDFHLNYHRPLPADADITQIILKKERTGNWTVNIVIEHDPDRPPKPDVETIDAKDTVGIDLGITKFIHDSDNRAFNPLNEERDRDRIENRHRDLSQKTFGSNNWEKSRQSLAKAYKRLRNRRDDYREKLAHQYTSKYDAVFLEDLNVKPMLEHEGNSRNIASMSWRQTIHAFKRHGKKNGCHVIEVDPRGTTKRCSQCGCATEKPLWVREHSCPSCGFTADRDYNSALEIKRLGLDELGVGKSDVEQSLESVGQGMAESTLAETALTVETERRLNEVSPKCVVETRSPCLNEQFSNCT